MRTASIGGTDVEECSLCEGIFLERGELAALLLRQDEHRRGLLRRLLGFRGH